MLTRLVYLTVLSLIWVGPVGASPGWRSLKTGDAKLQSATRAARSPGAGLLFKRRGITKAAPAGGNTRLSTRTTFAAPGRRGTPPRHATEAFVRNDGTFDPNKLDALAAMQQAFVAPYDRLEEVIQGARFLELRVPFDVAKLPTNVVRMGQLRTKIARLKVLGEQARPALDEVKEFLVADRSDNPPPEGEPNVAVARVAFAIANGAPNHAIKLRLLSQLKDLGPAQLRLGLQHFSDGFARRADALAGIRARHQATIGPAEALYQEIEADIVALLATR